MKIIKIEIFEVALPLRESFSTGFGKITTKPNIIVKLTSANGSFGYGEGATLSEPVYTAETSETCKVIIKENIAPRILGNEYPDPNKFVASYSDIIGNNIAKTAVETAFWDLYAKQKKTSLKKLFHGTKDKVITGESIGVTEDLNSLDYKINDLLQKGFVRIKIKIKPGWDSVPLSYIRSKWPEIDLSVDANASYDYDKHHNELIKLDKFNLSMIEQPFTDRDFVNHSRLQSEIKTPICLDESIQSLLDAQTAIELKCCMIINIKPGRVGGIINSIEIHDYAQAHNIGVWCGGMLETGIGRGFNIALATKSNFIYPADMSPHNSFYSDDIVEPNMTIDKDGFIKVPDNVSTGYNVVETKLKKYTKSIISIGV